MLIYKTQREWNELLQQSIFHTNGVQFGACPCSGGKWSWLIKYANDKGSLAYSPVISLAHGNDIRPLSSWAILLNATGSNIINEAFVPLAQGIIIENIVDINYSNGFWYSPVKLKSQAPGADDLILLLLKAQWSVTTRSLSSLRRKWSASFVLTTQTKPVLIFDEEIFQLLACAVTFSKNHTYIINWRSTFVFSIFLVWLST